MPYLRGAVLRRSIGGGRDPRARLTGRYNADDDAMRPATITAPSATGGLGQRPGSVPRTHRKKEYLR